MPVYIIYSSKNTLFPVQKSLCTIWLLKRTEIHNSLLSFSEWNKLNLLYNIVWRHTERNKINCNCQLLCSGWKFCYICIPKPFLNVLNSLFLHKMIVITLSSFHVFMKAAQEKFSCNSNLVKKYWFARRIAYTFYAFCCSAASSGMRLFLSGVASWQCNLYCREATLNPLLCIWVTKDGGEGDSHCTFWQRIKDFSFGIVRIMKFSNWIRIFWKKN